MEFNKNEFAKVNDRKVLHKVKKQWLVISVALLGMLGIGANVQAHASVQTNTNANVNQTNHSQLSSNTYSANGRTAGQTAQSPRQVLQQAHQLTGSLLRNQASRNYAAHLNLPLNSNEQKPKPASNSNRRVGAQSPRLTAYNNPSGIEATGVMGEKDHQPNGAKYTLYHDGTLYLHDGALICDGTDWNHNAISTSTNLNSAEINGIRSLALSDDHLFSNIGDFAFSNLPNLRSVKNVGNSGLNVQSPTGQNNVSLNAMFYKDLQLTNISALSTWNTHNVKFIGDLFSSDKSLSDITPLQNWDVSNVVNMACTFGCASNVSGNIMNGNYFDYLNKYSGTAIHNVNALKNWRTSRVTNIDGMFRSCTKLSNISGLQNWDVHNVKSMEDLFGGSVYKGNKFFTPGDYLLTDLNPLRNWDTSHVSKMAATFEGTGIRNTDGLSNWSTNQLTTISGAFFGDNNLTNVNGLRKWFNGPNSRLDNLIAVFTNDPQLSDISGLRDWNVSNVVNGANRLFAGDSSLSDLSPLRNWNVANFSKRAKSFTNGMYAMFAKTGVSDTSPLQNWNLGDTCSLGEMFVYDPNLKKVNLSNWDTRNVRFISSNFNLPNLKAFLGMFSANSPQKGYDSIQEVVLGPHADLFERNSELVLGPGPHVGLKQDSELANDPVAKVGWVSVKGSNQGQLVTNGKLMADNTWQAVPQIYRYDYQVNGHLVPGENDNQQSDAERRETIQSDVGGDFPGFPDHYVSAGSITKSQPTKQTFWFNGQKITAPLVTCTVPVKLSSQNRNSGVPVFGDRLIGHLPIPVYSDQGTSQRISLGNLNLTFDHLFNRGTSPTSISDGKSLHVGDLYRLDLRSPWMQSYVKAHLLNNGHRYVEDPSSINQLVSDRDPQYLYLELNNTGRASDDYLNLSMSVSSAPLWQDHQINPAILGSMKPVAKVYGKVIRDGQSTNQRGYLIQQINWSPVTNSKNPVSLNYKNQDLKTAKVYYFNRDRDLVDANSNDNNHQLIINDGAKAVGTFGQVVRWLDDGNGHLAGEAVSASDVNQYQAPLETYAQTVNNHSGGNYLNNLVNFSDALSQFTPGNYQIDYSESGWNRYVKDSNQNAVLFENVTGPTSKYDRDSFKSSDSESVNALSRTSPDFPAVSDGGHATSQIQFKVPDAGDTGSQSNGLQNNQIRNGDSVVVIPFSDEVPESAIPTGRHYLVPVNMGNEIPTSRNEFERGTLDDHLGLVPDDQNHGNLEWVKAPETVNFVGYDPKTGQKTGILGHQTYQPTTKDGDYVGKKFLINSDAMIPAGVRSQGYTELNPMIDGVQTFNGEQYFTWTAGGGQATVYVSKTGMVPRDGAPVPSNVKSLVADFKIDANVIGNDGGTSIRAVDIPVTIHVPFNAKLGTTYYISSSDTRDVRRAIVNYQLQKGYIDHDGQKNDLISDSIMIRQGTQFPKIGYKITEDSHDNYHIIAADNNETQYAGQFMFTPSKAIINYAGMVYDQDANGKTVLKRSGEPVESVLTEGYYGMRIDPANNNDIFNYFNIDGWSINQLRNQPGLKMKPIYLAGYDNNYKVRTGEHQDVNSGLFYLSELYGKFYHPSDYPEKWLSDARPAGVSLSSPRFGQTRPQLSKVGLLGSQKSSTLIPVGVAKTFKNVRSDDQSQHPNPVIPNRSAHRSNHAQPTPANQPTTNHSVKHNDGKATIRYYDPESNQTVDQIQLDGQNGVVVDQSNYARYLPIGYSISSDFNSQPAYQYGSENPVISVPVVKLRSNSDHRPNHQPQPKQPGGNEFQSSNNQNRVQPASQVNSFSDHSASQPTSYRSSSVIPVRRDSSAENDRNYQSANSGSQMARSASSRPVSSLNSGDLSSAANLIQTSIQRASRSLASNLGENRSALASLESRIQQVAERSNTSQSSLNGNRQDYSTDDRFTAVPNGRGFRYLKLLDFGPSVQLHRSLDFFGKSDQIVNQFQPNEHLTLKVLKTYQRVVNGKVGFRYLVQIFGRRNSFPGYVTGNSSDVEPAYYAPNQMTNQRDLTIQVRNWTGIEIHSSPVDWGDPGTYQHYVKHGQELHVLGLNKVGDLYRFAIRYRGSLAYVTANRNFVRVI